VRIVLRLLCVTVLASAAITVWTRAALVFVLGPQLTSVCLWIAAGGSLCAVITLAWARKPGRVAGPACRARSASSRLSSGPSRSSRDRVPTTSRPTVSRWEMSGNAVTSDGMSWL